LTRRRRLLLLFLAVSVVAGFAFWQQADWCFYVDMRASGGGMVPKSELSPP
jgi:hypothetical protein